MDGESCPMTNFKISKSNLARKVDDLAQNKERRNEIKIILMNKFSQMNITETEVQIELDKHINNLAESIIQIDMLVEVWNGE
jgi:molybdopterin-biosynthesis enzyme MoeA-like protein